MQQYLARRLLLFIPTLFLVSAVIFAVLRVLPGDVAVLILAGPEGQGRYTEADLHRVRAQMGLDQPMHIQYLTWVSHAVRLDLGTSLYNNLPVRDELAHRLPVTLELAMVTLVASLLIAVPLGVLMALRQDTLLDYVLRIVTIGGLAMPPFWTGSLIILALVLFFGWMPPIGWKSILADPWGNLQLIIFPAVAMGYFYAAIVSRMTRSTMLEVLRQDYVRTAWAKGLRERVVVWRHVLRNAMLPVITISAFQFGTLLGGTVVMEWLFALPGLGTALVNSVQDRDYPMVQAIILLIALWFMLINLAVDMLYGWLDPRIRYR